MSALRSASRRRLLGALAAAPLAITLPGFAAPNASRRLLVLVFLYGGNDGFNTWVPYTDPLYYRLRPTIAIPRDAVIRITDRHGFHPALAPLVPLWEARSLALVQGIGYPAVTQQHYRDMEIAFTAFDSELRPAAGWITRALRHRAADVRAIGFDVLDTRALDPMGPFRGDRIPTVQVHYAQELLARRRIEGCAIEANTPGAASFARDPVTLPPATLRTRFPQDQFGQQVRAAVELAAADPGIAVIHLTLNGADGDKHHSVDTHWNQLQHHGDALSRLAAGLVALRAGLAEIGRWEESLVSTYDEFGRSPVENEDRGTHHGLATTHFAMGGRVRGGLYGEPPPVENLHPIGGPQPAVDTRCLWAAVVRDWWGGDAAAVFEGRYEPLPLLAA